MTLASRLILLDRDGVINVDHGYVHKPEDWEWCPGAPEAIQQLALAGYELFIVTNQSGVGRGMYTRDDFFELMAQVKRAYFWHLGPGAPGNTKFPSFPPAACWHHPDDGCDCRKPKTGLWRDEIEPLFLPPVGCGVIHDQSWFVDDKFENLDFGREIGFNLAWITQAEDNVREPLDYEPFGSLHHFAETLLQRKIPWTPAGKIITSQD